MQNLTKASGELYRWQSDECFESLTAVSEHCRRQKEACVDHWVPPRSIQTNPADVGRLMLAAGRRCAITRTDSNGSPAALRPRSLGSAPENYRQSVAK